MQQRYVITYDGFRDRLRLDVWLDDTERPIFWASDGLPGPPDGRIQCFLFWTDALGVADRKQTAGLGLLQGAAALGSVYISAPDQGQGGRQPGGMVR